MTPALPHRLSGYDLTMRRVVPNDADYLHRLRVDPALSRHLSPVSGGIDGQRDWIKQTLNKPNEAYFLILTPRPYEAPRPCGVVRIYDVTPQRFTWGSWVLDPHAKPPRAALASAMLIYTAGFAAGCEEALFDVRRANWRTLAFHDRFGVPRVGTTQTDIHYRMDRARWADLAPRHANTLNRAKDTATLLGAA